MSPPFRATNEQERYLFILTLPKLTFLPNVRLNIHLGAEKLHEHEHFSKANNS